MFDDAPIAVIGAGSWGTALALRLAYNANQVRLWGHDTEHMELVAAERCNTQYLAGYDFPDQLSVYANLDSCLSDINDVLIVVPSYAFRSVLQQLKNAHPDYTRLRVAWGTKGLDPASQQLLHQVVVDELSQVPAAIISGPSFAKEVAAQLPTAVSIAGNEQPFVTDLIARLHAACFRVYRNDDFLGVQLCGVLKNILAIGVGIADGLGLGANSRAALVTRGLSEMQRICVAMGGEAKTLMSLAGVGDLVLTCTDNQSRNRRFGMMLGRGASIKQAREEIGQEIEGYFNSEQMFVLANHLQLDAPITEQVYAMLYQGVTPKDALHTLINREPNTE